MIRPRKRFAPITAREWLDTLHRANGPESDWAVELLAVLDQVEDPSYDEELMLTDVAERTGNLTIDTMDDLVRIVTDMKHLQIWADRDETFKEIQGVEDEKLDSRMEAFARKYDALEARSFALSELCMAAGIIAKDDYTTDPMPLLAMFLPVD